jgi:hypothetical protein
VEGFCQPTPRSGEVALAAGVAGESISGGGSAAAAPAKLSGYGGEEGGARVLEGLQESGEAHGYLGEARGVAQVLGRTGAEAQAEAAGGEAGASGAPQSELEDGGEGEGSGELRRRSGKLYL